MFSFHKLGWFRLSENNIPFVQFGDVFLDKIHHARTENCAQQYFKSVLEASYYVNNKKKVKIFYNLFYLIKTSLSSLQLY